MAAKSLLNNVGDPGQILSEGFLPQSNHCNQRDVGPSRIVLNWARPIHARVFGSRMARIATNGCPGSSQNITSPT